MCSIKALYLNLIDDKEVIMADMNNLLLHLQAVVAGDRVIQEVQIPSFISRATEQAISERFQEVRGYKEKFKTTQIDPNAKHREVLLATEGLALQLEAAGVQLLQPGLININDICTLHYDANGRIVKTTPDLGLAGLSAIEVIAGICAQDFGLVIEREDKLIYLYSSARYEKTPKHVENGYDYFVGEDFLEWHRRIPMWGLTLSQLLEQTYLALKQNKLDRLTIDLKGRHLYTDGNIVVRRYERDYALALPTREGEHKGMIVFADSLFKNINDELNPFFGGKHLAISSPRHFHQHFHLIHHAAFNHHPYGMRDKNGKPCSI